MIDECHAVHGLSGRHQHKGLGIFVVVKAGAGDGYLFARPPSSALRLILALVGKSSSFVGPPIIARSSVPPMMENPTLWNPVRWGS